jgi:tripartite-type tricarboxylate transporter receptor subunit TctC
VAFVAVTVRVEELPTAIEFGLAVMLTFGAGFEVPVTLPPQPIISSTRDKLKTSVAEKSVRLFIKAHILA